jgi:hypothetical protein
MIMKAQNERDMGMYFRKGRVLKAKNRQRKKRARLICQMGTFLQLVCEMRIHQKGYIILGEKNRDSIKKW